MSFSFSAAGSPAEVASSLEKAGQYVTADTLGSKIHELLLAEFQQRDPVQDAGHGQHWRYEVSAAGHSGAGSRDILNLNVTVSSRPVPMPDQEKPA